MNKIDVQQTGGFPLETDTLDFMQDSYKMLQQLAAALGDNFILSGCQQVGSYVSDGYLVINGEILPFVGGLLQDKVVVRETSATRNFQNGQNKLVYFTRVAQFGTGDTFILFADLKPLKALFQFRNLPTQISDAINQDSSDHLATAKAVKTLADLINGLVPAGIIAIWSGSIADIPAGWQLYEALRDKFVLGAGNKYAVGSVGGEETHKLTIDEMPKHSHTSREPDDSNNFDNGSATRYGDFPVTRATSETGGDQPHNNMPPYYAFAYIIKL